MAMDANGDFVVAYQVLNTTTYLYGVSAQRYNLAGSPQGKYSGSQQREQRQRGGRVAQGRDGLRRRLRDRLPGVRLEQPRRLCPASTTRPARPQGSTFRVNTPQQDNQGAPSIAMDSAGDFVIAWLDGGTTQTAGVYAQRYNSSGVAQGSNTAIGTAAGASNPSVAMEPTGQYVIAWQYTQTVGGPNNDDFTGVEAQAFDSSGNATTSVVVLSTSEDYDQGDAAVAIDTEGDFVVAWDSYGQGGTASSQATIIAQRVNSAGTLIGPTQFQPFDPVRRQPDAAEDRLRCRWRHHHRLAEQAQCDERQSERLRPAVRLCQRRADDQYARERDDQ